MIRKGAIHPGAIAILGLVAIGIIVLVVSALDELFLRIDLYGLFSAEVFQLLLAIPIEVLSFLVGIVLIGFVIVAIVGIISKILR